MNQFRISRLRWVAPLALVVALGANLSFAGVSRTIQDRYRRGYENKALFLKLPIYADKQHIFIVGRSVRPELAPAATPPRLKVGDQVRILGLDFGGDEIKFKLGAIEGARTAELVFKFDASLQEDFPNASTFDSALEATFTEGLKYTDLEDAKRSYVEDQFERAARNIAASSGSTREFVLKNMAPHLPAYQDALRDVENLKSRNQDLSAQVSQLQSDNRRLDSELHQQQAEVTRLKGLSATLQEKIDNSSSQLSRLGEELRSARGMTQSYQAQLANLQRSLNLKVDANRDLASQIADLGLAMKKAQKDNENLEAQNSSLRSNLEHQQAVNSRLSGEIEDLKTSSQKMSETIKVLTSKEDSLARQYLTLKKEKENLEDISTAVNTLRTQIVEEKSTGGSRFSMANLYLRNIPLGSLEWKLPEHLGHKNEKTGEVRFRTESVDYVRLAQDERNILRSLGERMKLGVRLVSPLPTMEVKAEKDETLQEVGERDQATWRWKIYNNGTQDVRLMLSVYMVNRNADEIPILKAEHLVQSSSVVRQVRGYLQPIPVAAGVLLGFLLFGIFGIFRRGKKPASIRTRATVQASEPPPYIGQKQL